MTVSYTEKMDFHHEHLHEWSGTLIIRSLICQAFLFPSLFISFSLTPEGFQDDIPGNADGPASLSFADPLSYLWLRKNPWLFNLFSTALLLYLTRLKRLRLKYYIMCSISQRKTPSPHCLPAKTNIMLSRPMS